MFIYNLLVSEGTFVDKLLIALAFLIAATFAITIHEFSHAFVAKLNGDLTAKSRGRLTLNPIAHFDPIGLMMMLLVGFGWAKPVPINSSNFTNYKRGMFTVSIAGVVSNIVVAGICMLLLFLLTPVLLASTASSALYVLQYLAYALLIIGIRLNMMLAFFNLIPIYPLDGYNIVNTFLPAGNGYQRFMVRYGTFVLLAIIIIGNIGDAFGFKFLDIFGLFGDLISELLMKIMSASVATFLV